MPQSGNTKRKKRNQKKQQSSTTSVVDESINASTNNLEEKQKDESGEGVSNRKVLDEFDDIPQDGQKSSDVRKKKKKKKKKKRKENVNDNPSTCKKSDSSDSCDEITENAEQLDTLEENKKLGREGVEESPVTNDEVSEILSVHEHSPVEDVSNNPNISSEAVVLDSSHEITEEAEPLDEMEFKEKDERKTNEETCIAEILSVVCECEDIALKDESGEGVSNRKVLDEFDDIPQDEHKSSDVRKKKKKKKKKKKRKESNFDVIDNPSTCKKSDSSDSCDEITENAEQLDTLEENKKLGCEGVVESPATNNEVSEILSVHEHSPVEDVNNNPNISCEAVVLDSSHEITESAEPLDELKEKNERKTADDDTSKILSVVCEDIALKGDEEDNHVNDELSCATDLLVEKTSITKKETHSSMTSSHCEDETPPDMEVPAEGLSLEFISSDDERPEIGAERNFDCITRLLIGVGTHCLRQYFKSIHPNWSNLPSDASALKKGVLKLQSHEKQKFYSGNIEEWDVTLLIRVLRFSAVSSVELKNHPDIDDALREIQDTRNKVVAHAKDKKISENDFKFYWNQIKANLLTIGADEEEINSTLTDNTALSNEQYRQLFLEELQLRKFSEQSDTIESNDETLVNPPVELSTRCWDAFMKFRDHVNSFKSSQTHYILLTDSITQADLQNFKVLSAISWKMVLDFNPSSEDNGLYKAFNSQNSLKRMLTPFTPGEIKKVGFSSLPKQIDSKRTQWLFVNGRKEDTDDSKPKLFPDWHQQSVKHISTFFSCCSQSEKFDNQKSVTCLLLPISKVSAPFVELTLQRLEENFSEFDLNFVCIDDSYQKMSGFKQPQEFPLSSKELKNGIKGIFNVSEDLEKYKMPSFHEGVPIPLSTREYVYMNESLELFYIGCEQEAIDFDREEEEREKDEEEHRMSFLSGNRISTGSLYFNHDAKRVIEKDIEIHIQRLVDQTLTHSDIVRIAHSPGTGGSTIARRVLWNLHKSFPCASVKLPSHAEYDEDSNFVSDLCDRISLLENKCGRPPVILLDGHRHWKIQGLSNKIVRTLNSRGKNAVILECQRGSKPEYSLATHQNAHIHRVFYVNARLEDTESDLKEFKLKFHEESNRSARRVFHFPMLSMMEEFRDRLDVIVSDTLGELDDLEKDIAAFVAFLQIYAEQSTPALLLFEVFKSRLEISGGSQVTYDTIKNCFTGTLINLMVYESKRKIEGESFARYTLQHHAVATLVFDKYQKAKRQSFYKFVYEFLDYSVSSIEKFRSLYCHLFLFNRDGNRKHRFSLLIEKLKSSNPKEAAIIFSKAAERIPDPRVYGHAARFYAKMTQPNFKKAEALIAAGLKLSESKGKAKSIQDSKGVVLSIELKHKIHAKKVKSIQKLEELANRAITAFKLARDFPPSFHSPLIGEVEVWLSCIEWIVSNQCSGDTEEAIKFLTVQAPPFFRTCMGDCFRLLDIVDDILMSSTFLSDPEESRDHAQRVRISLVTTIKPKRSLGKGPRREIDDLCLSLVSNKNLSLATQKEVKRFKAMTFLSLYRREPQRFKTEDLQDLVKLLEEMVLVEKDCSFARHFLQLCPQITGRRCYSLEQSWKVCCEWLHEPDSYDCMRFYYGMVMSFMQILNGFGPSGFFAQYKTMVQKLKEASYGHCRRNISLHFLGKNGDGMSKLISYASLLTGETTYRPDDSEAVKSFWTVESRRKLKECAGRLRVKVGRGNKQVTTIELLEGDIELYVGKSADIGKPGIDFDKDAKVYFVVSFNLTGPIANGITVESSTA